MTSPPPDHKARRRAGRPNEAELLAAMRVVSGAERRGVEEAEKLCQDARRVLEAASVDAERSRADAEQVLAEARSEAQRIVDKAERVLAESRVEAERIVADSRVEVAGVARDPDPAPGGEAPGDSVGPRRREAALSAIDPSVEDVAVLRRLLSDDLSADVRLAAIVALARTSESDQLGALGVALADPHPVVRARSVETLPVAATSRAASQVLAAAEDHHQSVRAAAYLRLAAGPSWVLWMALGRCSRRPELLAVLAEQPAADRLADLVLERVSSPDAGDRILALELIGHLGTPELLGEAVRALADAEAVVRGAAASQLAGHEPAVPGLVGALRDDPAPAVRREAARALGDVGDAAVVLAVLGAVQDPDADVRRLAAGALLRHPSPGLAHRLAAELTTSNLGTVGDLLLRMGADGEEALAEAVAGGPPERSFAAGELLRRSDLAPTVRNEAPGGDPAAP